MNPPGLSGGLFLNMRFPWANVALIALVVAELVTGYLGLTHSNPEWIAAMHLHRSFGFAILGLFVWKSRNILGSLRSGYSWRLRGREMMWSLLLLVGLLTTLGLGMAWSHLGPYYWLGFSGTTLHMNLAWMLIPLLLWHSLRHRISFRRRYLANRRNLLRAAGLALAGLLLWRTAELAVILSDGPGARRRYTGSYPEDGPSFPVTMWLNDRVQRIDPAEWRLTVGGHVEQPFELDFAEFQRWRHAVTATLDCTGGWHTTRRWEGIPVNELLARARLKSGAASITIRSRTGYFRRYSLAESERAVLAGWVDDAPLSPGHGFPARMVEPHKRGYDWVKWVDSITVNNTGKWWQPPLPLT